MDYPDAYISVTGDIVVFDGDINTSVAFKNCSPFTRCLTHLNDMHVETADNLDLVMNLYNLIECSDNYEQTSGSLWQYKRQEQILNANGNIDNLNTSQIY